MSSKDPLSRARRSWNMGRIRGKDTAPERVVRSMLHRMGLRFRLHVAELPGRPDIVMPKHGTVVFVNGCFWHRHKGCARCTTPSANRAFWERKFISNMCRDRKNTRALRAAGWRVLTVWGCQVADHVRLERLLACCFRSGGS